MGFEDHKLLFFLLMLGWLNIGPQVGAPAVIPAHRLQRIVIDAGHGGKDLGAVSLRGIHENDLVLEIARQVRDGLRESGIEVVLTRDSDRFVPLPLRAKVANKKNADLFISIHANASTSKALKGFEVYSLSEATDDNALALERAENSPLRLVGARVAEDNVRLRTVLWGLRERENRRESVRLSSDIGNAALRSIPIAARRMRTANFYVLKWTECPSVLVEIGYLSNHQDENKLLSKRYQRGLSSAIVKGILKFKDRFDRSNGFTIKG